MHVECCFSDDENVESCVVHTHAHTHIHICIHQTDAGDAGDTRDAEDATDARDAGDARDASDNESLWLCAANASGCVFSLHAYGS